MHSDLVAGSHSSSLQILFSYIEQQSCAALNWDMLAELQGEGSEEEEDDEDGETENDENAGTSEHEQDEDFEITYVTSMKSEGTQRMKV